MGSGTSSAEYFNNDNALYEVIFVLGGPGSGKGTNCSRIAKEYGYIHLCAGDLLREEVNSDTPIPLAELINSYLNEGKVVPADIMVGLLRTAMEKSVNNNPANNKFLIDGFPRDMKNLRCWVNIMTAIVNVQFVLFLDCSKETMLERRIKASGKYDENVETIIKQFETSTLPIIEYFRSINRIREVDANRDLDNVYSNISLIFSNLFIEKSQTNLLSKGYDFQVVFVLGGPGCGKGTNCSLIVKDYGYVHLSAGDLLREERNTGSALADMINTYIKEGKIVPADVTVGLLRAAMEKSVANNPTNNKFLIDGFPRDIDNLKCWLSSMNTIVNVQFLLFLDCSKETMLERLLERSKTSGRNDDNMETIIKRFDTYETSTRPIIEYFRDINKIREVDANRELEKVYYDVTVNFRI